MYILSFLTLVSDGQASMTQAEKFPDPLLKSDVNLFNHLVRKGCCGLLFMVLFFVDMEVARIQCR